jgi:iron complex transport system substrate-binding protein
LIRSASLFLLGLVGLCCGSVHAAGLRETDDRGQQIELSASASRIVSLAPHVTELIFAAGAGSRLVAATAYSDYPAQARRLPRVGDASRIDLERMVAIHPDLVIGWQTGNSAGDIARLEQLHVPVFLTEPRRLEDIPRLLRVIGRLAGTETQANAAAQKFEGELHALRMQYAHAPAVSVFYEIWHTPLMTVNGQHMINDVISLCGGRNVFAESGALTPTVSVESVLARDPEAIIASGSLYNDESVWQAWRRFPQLAAVQANAMFFVPPDLIQRQTPRILEGARLICGQLDKVRAERRGTKASHDQQTR